MRQSHPQTARRRIGGRLTEFLIYLNTLGATLSISGPKLASEQMAEMTKLRGNGEALHKADKHLGAVDVLAKALIILGVWAGSAPERRWSSFSRLKMLVWFAGSRRFGAGPDRQTR